MKHTKTLAAKLRCVRIIVVVETRRFMTCFSISQSLNGCGLLLLFHAFAISRLFNLYFRQVFPISFVFFPRSVCWATYFVLRVCVVVVRANVPSKSIRRPYFSIPISFVYLCYLLVLFLLQNCDWKRRITSSSIIEHRRKWHGMRLSILFRLNTLLPTHLHRKRDPPAQRTQRK